MDGASWPARWPPPAPPAAPVPPLPNQVRAPRAHLGGDFGGSIAAGAECGGVLERFFVRPPEPSPIPGFGGWCRYVRDFGVGMHCYTARARVALLAVSLLSVGMLLANMALMCRWTASLCATCSAPSPRRRPRRVAERRQRQSS